MSDTVNPNCHARAMDALEHTRERYHWALAALAAVDTTGHPDGLGALLEKAGLSRPEADALLADLTRAFPEAQPRWDWVLNEVSDSLGGVTPYTAVKQGRIADVQLTLAALL